MACPPIIRAPMGVAIPVLVADVSNAGGLGMLGLAGRDPEGIRRVIAEARWLADRPFGAVIIGHITRPKTWEGTVELSLEVHLALRAGS